MPIISLNDNWKINKVGSTESIISNIPFDAMQLDDRKENASTGKNEAWIDANDYEYHKNFNLENNYKDSIIYIDFESIYRNAEIYINNSKIDVLPYGYSESIVDITHLVKFDEENEIKVIARNSDQPNSRWYSGTGIVRPVNLIIYPKEHIVLNSIKLKTLDYKNKIVNIQLETTSVGCVSLDIFDKDKALHHYEFETDGKLNETIEASELELWDLENPNLYDFVFTFKNHRETLRFGLRTIEVSTKGFFINGERVVIKGACIHSDAQTLGAITSPFIEKRKVRLLKNVGYNAIRSAHNPICKYMLDACDELGMIIMDEYVDCWYFQKTLFDYSKQVKDYWKDDLKSMVKKDINHPSVMLYSLGNEVGETAQKEGIKLIEDFSSFIKAIDDSRLITCGINIVFNGMVKMGIGFYDEKKAQKELNKTKKRKQKVGSELFNDLTNLLSGRVLKQFATLPICDKATKEAFSKLDVAGYNYGIKRYKKDIKKYPDRIILGTETFCSDAREFILLNKKYPQIIGDFVWAGLDYLGEVGIGSRVDELHCNHIMSGGLGWISAGSGRIDLTGKENGEALYTKVAFEECVCKLATYSPKHYKMKHSVSSWKFSNAMPFYSYEGYENKTMPVEIYSNGDHYVLIQNDKIVSSGKCNKNSVNRLKIKYKPGYLKVVVFDETNRVIGTDILYSANKDELKLTIELENDEIKLDELVYAHIKLTDESGIIKPLQERRIHVEVENGELLSLASANPYNKEGFRVDTCKTFFGSCLAIVKPINNKDIIIKASCTDLNNETSVKIIE